MITLKESSTSSFSRIYNFYIVVPVVVFGTKIGLLLMPLHDLKPDTSQPITVLRSSFGSVVFSTTISTDFHQIPPSDPLFQTSDVVLISPNAAISLHRSEARYILILGFFFGGIVLNQLGLFRDLKEVKILSEWGIVFLWVAERPSDSRTSAQRANSQVGSRQDYESVGSVLHIRGKNILENEHVKIGAFQTLELELHQPFVSQKVKFRTYCIAMDKSWMDKKRGSREYFQGVTQFVEFASLSARNGKMLCPCMKCVNLILQPINVVRDHCWASGMMNNYKVWKFHGESAVATTATNCGSSQV
ncbi:uncharacterized protein LOC112024082 [Quercus suber]|uniref:uncharacterized protein LOC112024082 n=1 Tax=Quercus suber TaxID=58331 RepID=UPI0032DED535